MAFYLYHTKYLRLCPSRLLFSRYSSCASSDRKGLLLGVYTKDNDSGIELTPYAEEYNKSVNGKLLEQIHLTGNEVKLSKSFIFWGLDKQFNAVAVVGLGKKGYKGEQIELIDQESENVRIAASAGCRSLDSAGIKNIQIESFCDAENAAVGALLGTWKFQEYKTKKEIIPNISLYSATEESSKHWSIGVIKAESQNLARKLTDTPSNFLTPTIFASEAQNILSPLGIDVKVYDKKWAEEQKMFSFLSVAQGSRGPPKFLEITYNNSKSESPFVLVGKGVTFDSGGISIKPSRAMDEMRGDMGGAAAILCALYGLAKLKAQVNVKLLIPLVENMPSDTATKPGDVFRARNGKTICVDNTDAEGRLILADALCYSEDFKPKWVIDVATLTGAIKIALGEAATGVYSNSDSLYTSLQSAGSKTGDRVWRMPLWKYFTKQMTEYAAYDINNDGKGRAGSCTAAAFLREFVPKNTDWMHLDIAGVDISTTTTPYFYKGMTGRPTRTLIDFILAQEKC